MYLYIVISNKSASEHNIRPNKNCATIYNCAPVYTELCYDMENSNHFRWRTYVTTHRLHSLYLCTKYETWKLKTLGVRVRTGTDGQTDRRTDGRPVSHNTPRHIYRAYKKSVVDKNIRKEKITCTKNFNIFTLTLTLTLTPGVSL